MRFIKGLLVAIGIMLLAVITLIAITACVLLNKADQYQREDRVVAAPKTGVFVAADDAKIFVQRLGSKDAPAVVFIHGTGSWSETWRPSMEQAVKAGYQAFAIDLPPFGFSVPPPSGDYSKPRQAKRILAALDSAGIKQAVFVAHSFGAAPVMEALLSDPKRAKALILVDAALGLDSPQTDGADSGLQKVLRSEWISETISAGFLTNPSFTQKLLQSFISEKEKATPQWISLYQRPLSLAGSYQSIAQWLPELVSSRGQARSDQREAYARLPYPVTLIWGETDSITPVSQAINLQKLIPGSVLVQLPKAGHIPQIEEAEMFHQSLVQALRGVLQ